MFSFGHTGHKKSRRVKHSLPLSLRCFPSAPTQGTQNFLVITDVSLWPTQEPVSSLSLVQIFIESGAGAMLGAVRDQGVGWDYCAPPGSPCKTNPQITMTESNIK